MRLAILCAAVLLVLNAYLQWSAFGGLSADDAFITFRYAENWAGGLGPVYNAGERVEGYSDFLWLCILAAAHLVARDVNLPAQVAGLAAGVASVVLAVWALWRVYGVRERSLLLLVAALVGTSGYVAAWAVSGLESALYGLLLLGLWTAFACERNEGRVQVIVAAALCVAVVSRESKGNSWLWPSCVHTSSNQGSRDGVGRSRTCGSCQRS